MAVTFTLDGKTYRVKDYDELTLADWKRLTEIRPPDTDRKERDYTVALVAAHTGLPKSKIRKLSAASWDAMASAIKETLDLAMADHAKHYADGATWIPPETFDFAGIAYAVPRDLDTDMTTGQWFDLQDIATIEHQADAMHKCLSICLVPSGKTYAGSADNEAIFWDMRMVDAFAMSAFFFDSSERFRRAINRCLSLCLTFVAHKFAPVLRRSQSTTGALQDLSAQPN